MTSNLALRAVKVNAALVLTLIQRKSSEVTPPRGSEQSVQWLYAVYINGVVLAPLRLWCAQLTAGNSWPVSAFI
jgi:hypothetical protein